MFTVVYTQMFLIQYYCTYAELDSVPAVSRNSSAVARLTQSCFESYSGLLKKMHNIDELTLH
eukprot:11627313-Karenia_brevis.AAC.1